MAATRRAHILMEPDEYKRLRALAKQKRTSVAGLIRSAVRQTYFAPRQDSTPIVEAILQMRLPPIGWDRAKKEIEKGHARLP